MLAESVIDLTSLFNDNLQNNEDMSVGADESVTNCGNITMSTNDSVATEEEIPVEGSVHNDCINNAHDDDSTSNNSGYTLRIGENSEFTLTDSEEAGDSRMVLLNEYNWTSAANVKNEDQVYIDLNRVMYILCIAVQFLSINVYLSFILAIIYLANEHHWFFTSTYGAIVVPAIFIVTVSRIWKSNTNYNTTRTVISGLASVLTNAEVLLYYQECDRQYKLALSAIRKKDPIRERKNYKLTLQRIDDLRYLVLAITGLQAVPQIIIQLTLIFLNTTDYYFILPLQILVITNATLCIVCAIVTYIYCNYSQELGEKHRVSMLSLLLTCLSDCLYVADVFSDLLVAGKFLINEQWLYFSLTLAFIIIPGIYITWLKHNRNKIKLKLEPTNLIKMLFNLDPVFGYWKAIKLIREIKQIELAEPVHSGVSDQRRDRHIELVKNNFNVAISRYNESYTEATSQLILQTAILLGQFNDCKSMEDIFREDVIRSKGFQMLSVVTSLISLAAASVLMFRSKRINQYIKNTELREDDPLKFKGMLIQFMGYFPVVVTRILAISFAASKFALITSAVLVCNWIGVYAWLRPKCKLSKLIYSLGQAAIYTYTPPINLLSIELIFHGIYLSENVVATFAWSYTRIPEPTVFDVGLPVGIVAVSTVIGLGFRYWYRQSYTKYMKVPVDYK